MSAQYQYPAQVQPHANLDTNRSLTKFILIGIVTLYIYQMFVLARLGEDLNMIASLYDNKRTMNYWLVALLVGPITLSIMDFVWFHSVSDRLGNEQARRGLPRTISATDFWLWGVLGSVIIVGPFIYMHKLLHSMNALAADYNMRGDFVSAPAFQQQSYGSLPQGQPYPPQSFPQQQLPPQQSF